MASLLSQRRSGIATSICCVVRDIGYYHHARFEAVAGISSSPVNVFELFKCGSVAAFNRGITGDEHYLRHTVFPSGSLGSISNPTIRNRLRRQLDVMSPGAICVSGWSDPEALAALEWCLDRRVPAILMSDSQAVDCQRGPLKESVKRRLVRLCSAALVGGTPHADYAAALGMPRSHIFLGFDVVSNYHFAQGADAALRDPGLRSRLRLPVQFFLASARFIPKKNLLRLLAAFARYRILATHPWNLILLGDGPLRAEVRSTISRLGLETAVSVPGFKQYDELPSYYGLAAAFVHASSTEQWGLVVNEAMAARLPILVSNRCGCAPDLVEEGRNGFTFDPYDTEELAHLMLQVASMPATERAAMGRASIEIISRWTPECFATNLMKAVELALATPRPKSTVVDKALLWALIHRPSAVS